MTWAETWASLPSLLHFS